MNPKCQTRPGFDTFSAKSADLTGLKMRRITRGGLFDRLVGAGDENRWQVKSRAPWRSRSSMSPRGSRWNVCPQKYKQDGPDQISRRPYGVRRPRPALSLLVHVQG